MPKTTTRPMVRIHDQLSNQIIDREMTVEEFEKAELDRAEAEAQKAEAEAKATARQAILDRLGLTADEAALILG